MWWSAEELYRPRTKTSSLVTGLIRDLGDCMTPQSAKKILKLNASAKHQARINELSRLNTAGTITAEQKQEYFDYIPYGTHVSILQSQARLLLANSNQNP
jgi:hypothetical protein